MFIQLILKLSLYMLQKKQLFDPKQHGVLQMDLGVFALGCNWAVVCCGCGVTLTVASGNAGG